MSYHIYTTEGIILKRKGFGEANIILHVLTRELGLIIATAQSARLSTSKLRPALQEYAFVSISCVKGKSGWKITNVIEKKNFFYIFSENGRELLARIAQVLIKMIPGESPNPEIFSIVLSGLEFLREEPSSDIQIFEVLIVLRILTNLGYVVSDSNSEVFLKDSYEWSNLLLQHVLENKKSIVQLINKALKESQL